MMTPQNNGQDSDDLCEAYVMLDGGIDDKEDHESPQADKTLIVKRANLQFNDKSYKCLDWQGGWGSTKVIAWSCHNSGTVM